MQFEKFIQNPKILIPLFSVLVLNLTVLITAYIYVNKSEKIAYDEAFKSLEAINNIKIHKLELFFKYRKTDIETLVNDSEILHLAKDFHNGAIGKKDSRYLKSFISNYIYSDLMLLDIKSEKIVFSLNEPKALGVDVGEVGYEHSNLRKIYKKMLQTKDTFITDMHLCEFTGGEPIMVLAAPIYDGGEMITILLLQLPHNSINEIVDFRDGMWDSGESYVVGSDNLLRSNIYLDRKFSVINSFRYPDRYKVDTLAVKEALNGNNSKKIIKDYRDIDVLSAYKHFDIDGFRWVVISEVDKSEIGAYFEKIKEDIKFFSALLSILVTVIVVFVLDRLIKVSVVAPLEESDKKSRCLGKILDDSLNEIYIFDVETLKFTYVNKGAIINSGYDFNQFLTMSPYDIKPEYDKERFLGLIEPLVKKRVEMLELETQHIRKDGTIYDVDIHLQLMHIDGKDKIVAFVNDITKRNKAIKEREFYYDKAIHDHLTKVYNRQMFDDFYKNAFKSSVRHNIPLSLILFDIDNFKKVNDTYGHDVGDDVLVKVSALINSLVRDSDIFARWGGEEFVVLLKETVIEDALKKAEFFRAKIAELHIAEVGHITCSFGVATLKNENDMLQIFKQADEALYKAKGNGKNRVETV